MAKSIQEQMAEALAKEVGEKPEAILQRMQQKEEVSKSQLAQMLETAKQQRVDMQAEAVQVNAAKSTAKAKGEENDKRSVFVIMSDTAMEAYIILHKRYRSKSEDEALVLSKKYLASKQKLKKLIVQPDLDCALLADMVPVAEAELERAKAHKDLTDSGYRVLSATATDVILE